MATDPRIAALQSQITNDPRVRAILAAPDQRGHGTTPGSREAKLYELGKQLGLPEGYYLSANGTITTKAPWWVKYVGPAAVAAGGYGLSLLGPATAATGTLGAGEASTTLAATGGLVPGLSTAAAPVAATTTAAAAAPTVAKQVAAGFDWKRLAPVLIGGGLQAVGSYMAARSAGKAADQEAAAADKALALQKEIFERNQANQRPFIDVGTGAITRLNNLMGGGSFGSLAGSNPQTGAPAPPPQMVNMRAPDGTIKAVPYTEVPHWEQMKAVRVF